MMNSEIQLESEVGKGSTFSFTLELSVVQAHGQQTGFEQAFSDPEIDNGTASSHTFQVHQIGSFEVAVLSDSQVCRIFSVAQTDCIMVKIIDMLHVNDIASVGLKKALLAQSVYPMVKPLRGMVSPVHRCNDNFFELCFNHDNVRAVNGIDSFLRLDDCTVHDRKVCPQCILIIPKETILIQGFSQKAKRMEMHRFIEIVLMRSDDKIQDFFIPFCQYLSCMDSADTGHFHI